MALKSLLHLFLRVWISTSLIVQTIATPITLSDLNLADSDLTLSKADGTSLDPALDHPFTLTLSNSPRCFDADPDTMHLPLNYADCEPALTALRSDPDYTSDPQRYNWAADHGGAYRSWPQFPRRCVITLGVVREGMTGMFSLRDVERLVGKIQVDCPKKGGRQWVTTRKGWWVEVYRPTAPWGDEDGEGGAGDVLHLGETQR